MKRRAHVALVGQAHENQHRAAQLHAKWPRNFLTVMLTVMERRHRRIRCLRHILAKSMAARFRMAKLPKNKTTSFSRICCGEAERSPALSSGHPRAESRFGRGEGSQGWPRWRRILLPRLYRMPLQIIRPGFLAHAESRSRGRLSRGNGAGRVNVPVFRRIDNPPDISMGVQ